MRDSGVTLKIKNTPAKPNSEWNLLLPRFKQIAADGDDVHTSAQLFHHTRAKPTSEWHLLLPRLKQIAEDSDDVDTAAQIFHARKKPAITQILQAFKNTRNAQDLLHILLNLSERGFVENFYILRSISGIANNYKYRVRDIESWSSWSVKNFLISLHFMPGLTMMRYFWHGSTIRIYAII